MPLASGDASEEPRPGSAPASLSSPVGTVSADEGDEDADEATDADPSAGSTRRMRVLLVEDEPMMQGFLQQRLALERDIEVVGTVASVWDAQTALVQLEVDLILLDYYLEDADGMHLLRSLRGTRSDQSPAPRVLFCTGYASRELAAEARANDAWGVVDKHRLTEELVPALRAVHAGKTWFHHEPHAASHPASARLRVLVAEDESQLRQLLAEALTEAGMSPRLVWSADEALELLEREPYDLLLLDCHLGGRLHCREALDEVQDLAPELPVLLLAEAAEAERYRDHPSVRGLLVPPPSPTALQQAVAQALEGPVP
ncbi:MAG: response regulator [Armatimonadota bacterium]